MNVLPWIVGALVVLGALALLLLRRRRRTDEVYYETSYDESPVAEPEAMVAAPLGFEAAAPSGATAAAPDAVTANDPAVLSRSAEPPAGMTMGMAAAPAAVASAATNDGSPVPPVVEESGEPAIDLSMRPVRAGVGDENARVEFELIVDNKGTATARDVRVSTWMFPAGSRRGTEMEYMLIGERGESRLAEVDAGDAKRIDSAVALPTERLESDSLLPIVVAEARYRLADGSEERTTARFAVGVPVDDDLAHFDLENPSGLHEGVEARPVETEQA